MGDTVFAAPCLPGISIDNTNCKRTQVTIATGIIKYLVYDEYSFNCENSGGEVYALAATLGLCLSDSSIYAMQLVNKTANLTGYETLYAENTDTTSVGSLLYSNSALPRPQSSPVTMGMILNRGKCVIITMTVGITQMKARV